MKLSQQHQVKSSARLPMKFPLCLRKSALFYNLSDKEIICFAQNAKTQCFKKHKILYRQGKPAEFLYVICAGWIKLYHPIPDGDEIIIDMLTIGDMFGESVFCDKSQHMRDAQVEVEAKVLCIPSDFLKEQIQLNPALAFNILAWASQHHRKRICESALNAKQDASQRVGRFLLTMCPKNKKKSVVYNLPYAKALIANSLGMNNATFSRALTVLREKVSVCIIGSRVEIDSVEKLAKYV